MAAAVAVQNSSDANQVENDIRAGVRVLEVESAGLQALAGSLGKSFGNAVQTIAEMKARKGRLIVTGMGKSGHIARKIAATMASTGTPSLFVHPGEASHGDLGMVTEDDVVIALSNSGEAPELSDILAYTRRYSIPLIGMTSNPDSTLANYSDIKLLVPKAPEACPNGLAPTTSTTMMIALGDALAICLLERHGLTPEQYKVFHPGGKLGQKLLKVSELMTDYDGLPLIHIGDKMDRAILVMTEKNLGSVLIMDDNEQLCGIITDGDLKRYMEPGLLERPVTEIMSTGPKSISPNALAVEALDMMLNKFAQPITSLLVIDEDGKLSGMIRVQDCLQAGIT